MPNRPRNYHGVGIGSGLALAGLAALLALAGLAALTANKAKAKILAAQRIDLLGIFFHRGLPPTTISNSQSSSSFHCGLLLLAVWLWLCLLFLCSPFLCGVIYDCSCSLLFFLLCSSFD